MKHSWDEPTLIFEQYRNGVGYKAAIGERGICGQATVNERFYIGDQWHGARCGDHKPLVRYNVIKRIGDYKMAIVDIELKETQNQLRQPTVMNDPALCMETMARYKQLMETRKAMAKILGDRVIGT